MTLWYDVVGTSPLVSYVTTYSNVTSDEAIVWRNNGYGEPQKCWIFPYGPLPTIFDLRFRECPGNYEGGVAGVVVLALVAFVIFGVFCYCFNCIYRCDCSGGKKDY